MKVYVVQLHDEGTERDRIGVFKTPEAAVARFRKYVKEYESLGLTENEDERVDVENDPMGCFGKAVFVNSDDTQTEITVRDASLEDEKA